MNLEIKLSALLKLHDLSASPLSLSKSLGDGYLYTHNSFFKNIRTEALKKGYTYTTEDFCHYAVLPYASLPKILKAKKVPYFDNVTVLKEIEAEFPNKFKCAELIKVKSNYTLHESNHCIAHSYLQNVQINVQALSKDTQKVILMVMTESFANTVESLGNLFNTTDEHRLFYELNSYVNMNKKTFTSLQQAVDLIGIKNVYALVYISYIYSNCLHNDVPVKIYQQILDLVITDDELKQKALDSGAVKKLFFHAFELSEDFRVQTTGFYCQLMKIDTSIFKLFHFDILHMLKNTSAVKVFLLETEHLFNK